MRWTRCPRNWTSWAPAYDSARRPTLAAELESVRGQVRRIQNDLEPLRREVQTLSQARESSRTCSRRFINSGRVSDGIQKGVMDTRMVPIGPLFARFNRVVRDITRASGKQARLEIRGENTELDKRMIDELGDPLVHLVRNSVDHGIEPPDDAGSGRKAPRGHRDARCASTAATAS